ncbi:DUF3365 domain-containing protein [uncultured Planktosalinus sp.]|uniref:c-type heme family protein n=1 Tax=uncultured Planktosalinus sp. TaxID=1810935 RepID=UPI0030D9F61C
MKLIIAALIFVFILGSCKNNKETYEVPVAFSSDTEETHPGKKLLETHCYVCHAPQGAGVGHQNRIAPPMAMVQNHYIDSNTTKEAFVKDFLTFLEKPSEDIAKMPGAIRNFGLMPYQKFPQEALEHIADYLYEHNPLDETGRGKQDRGKGKGMGRGMGQTDTLKNTLEQKAANGLGYALETNQLLGQNLMGILQKEGTLHALEFCNIEAIPLTNQMEEKHRAVIKRVSDKNRNPNNAANEEEKYYIDYFQKEIAAGNDPKPVVLPAGEQTRFYYPIVTNSMCLQCHGHPDKIDLKVLHKINELYPNDLAIGYGENEVRGIWSIVF